MDISYLTIAWKFITGGKGGVRDYLLGVANTAVNRLSDATKATVKKVLDTTRTILSFCKSYSWLCPEKWRNDFDITLAALADVVSACDDLNVTPEELSKVSDAWKIAYAEWMAD